MLIKIFAPILTFFLHRALHQIFTGSPSPLRPFSHVDVWLQASVSIYQRNSECKWKDYFFGAFMTSPSLFGITTLAKASLAAKKYKISFTYSFFTLIYQKDAQRPYYLIDFGRARFYIIWTTAGKSRAEVCKFLDLWIRHLTL